jgi:hydrogenase nickel incorporation protein HypB
MCGVCGCGETTRAGLAAMAAAAGGAWQEIPLVDDRSEHGDHHEHENHEHQNHEHRDHHHDEAGQTVILEQQVLAKNDLLAQHNRGWLAGRSVVAVNLMSSPGSGKTTLLERTIRDLDAETAISVIEGDQETRLDAERIRATGRPVVQINTGSGCHLDAEMVGRGLAAIDPPSGSLVLIENVGNLVCPALFDLGEAARVVIMSVTEGADKPLKYPQMFHHADLVVVNKSDLLPYVQFEVADFAAAVHRVNPKVEIVVVSATTGEGMVGWYHQLRALHV